VFPGRIVPVPALLYPCPTAVNLSRSCGLHAEINSIGSINFSKKEEEGSTFHSQSCLIYIELLTGYQLSPNIRGQHSLDIVSFITKALKEAEAQAFIDDNHMSIRVHKVYNKEKKGAVLMKKTFIKSFLLVLIVCLSALLSVQARAEDPDMTYSISFTDQELDDLLAFIALYPDPLLAQMLPASTYPAEVAEAAAWLNSGGYESSIDEQNWAESVRAIAHYPNILQMMAENMDWTANLGDAFLNQPEDVTNSIQRLRWRARAVGNLVSNNEQSVIIEGDYIQIVPAQPQYIYVPQYEPSVVYVESPTTSYSSFITFGLGLTIGGWLSMDFDWDHHHVIYHGWDRPGWVNHARPYVHVRNVYINRSRPFLNQTWRHDRSHGDPARYLASRPSGPKADRYMRTGEVRGRTTTQPRPAGGMFGARGDTRAYGNRGRESRGIVSQQPAPLAPSISPRPTVPTPTVRQGPTIPSPRISERQTRPAPSVSQRPAMPAPGSSQRPGPVTPRVSSSPSSQPGPARETRQPARTPSVTYGGYRGADEAKAQSDRGQASRQSKEGIRPSTAPASHGRAPAKRNAPEEDRQPR
jgi:hypothetical protein